jgi:uncharacterized protein YkwD
VRRIAAPIAVAAIALVLAACGATSAPAPVADMHGCAGSNLEPEPVAAPRMRAAILCLVNAERARHGARPLAEDAALGTAAVHHSLDMGRRNYFEHRDPDGIEPWMRIGAAGYRAALVGENLGWGEAEQGTPAATMRHWMKSAGHRRNLLDPRYTQIGIGIEFDAPVPGEDGLPAAVYTTTFGSAAVAGT